MPKRVLTKREETAIRLCHHDFKGLSVEQAAKRMGIKIHSVQDLLKDAERKAPQLFPILNTVERAVLALIDNGAKIDEMAAGLGIQTRRIDRIIIKLRLAGKL